MPEAGELVFEKMSDDKTTDSERTASTLGASGMSGGGRSSPAMRLTIMATVPRCSLCSKRYEIGECVTHSTNDSCHHEFHEVCLTKHWEKQRKAAKKNKKKSGNEELAEEDSKCPICKEDYIIGELSLIHI